ncbi:helix-turn-helix domain-containing protein [Spirosoma sp. KCTC 42546]|uniref:helix-turn-helix transcriptional regulator n=1 Tax=Spirosoma sp. KCTC 42546 TaxID=2520506 RepID=UPI0011591CF9|nr:helix-turn-helix domain-containing protein [Spirosoma sp. KCTC 42546]QDK81256.1 helix-turn-helix domain-containing protein [Spirosoma sp. KCTC 42546]
MESKSAKINQKRGVRRSVSVADLSVREWLRPVEAMRLFGLGQSKFWVYANDGGFPTYRPGSDGKSRTVLVRRSEVEAFLASGKSVN